MAECYVQKPGPFISCSVALDTWPLCHASGQLFQLWPSHLHSKKKREKEDYYCPVRVFPESFTCHLSKAGKCPQLQFQYKDKKKDYVMGTTATLFQPLIHRDRSSWGNLKITLPETISSCENFANFIGHAHWLLSRTYSGCAHCKKNVIRLGRPRANWWWRWVLSSELCQ